MEHIASTKKEQVEGLNDEEVVGYVTELLKNLPKAETKIVALIGGPASGKGTFSKRLSEKLGRTTVLATDNYLKGDRPWRRANVEDAGNSPLLKYDPDYLNQQVQAIASMQDGDEVGIPQYDGSSGVAISQNPDQIPDASSYPTKVTGRQDFIIVEGDFQFLAEENIDLIIYLDVDDEVRLQNRLFRDGTQRPEDPDPAASAAKTKANFESRQATQFVPYTLPNRDQADMVIQVHAERLQEPAPDQFFKYTYDVRLR